MKSFFSDIACLFLPSIEMSCPLTLAVSLFFVYFAVLVSSAVTKLSSEKAYSVELKLGILIIRYDR